MLIYKMSKYDIQTVNGTLINPIPRDILNFRLQNQVRSLPLMWQNEHFSKRRILVNWLSDVAKVFKQTEETFHLTISYLDIVAPLMENVEKGKFQLIGMVCMWIAAKINEIYSPGIEDFVNMSNDTYTEEEMKDMEKRVLGTMGAGILMCPTPMDFVRYYSEDIGANVAVHNLSKELMRVYRQSNISTRNSSHKDLSYKDNENELVWSKYSSASIAAGAGFLASSLVQPSTSEKDKHYSSILGCTIEQTMYMAQRVGEGVKEMIDAFRIHTTHFSTTSISYLQNMNKVMKILQQVVVGVEVIDVEDTSIPYDSVIPIFVGDEWTKPTEIKFLGGGTYGRVYLVEDDELGLVVEKTSEEAQNQGVPSSYLRELAIGALVDPDECDCVIKFYKAHIGDEDLSIVMNLQSSSLAEFTVPIDQRKYVVRQLCEAMYHIHSRGIIHRDLKPANVLTNDLVKIKLADFGLSRYVQQPFRVYTPTVYTLWYRPPEILLGDNYTFAADIWSLGCTISEILTGRALFPGQDEFDQLYKIFRKLGTPNEEDWPGVTQLPEWNLKFSEESMKDPVIIFPDLVNDNNILAVDFILRMLQYNPNSRPDITEILNDPYLLE